MNFGYIFARDKEVSVLGNFSQNNLNAIILQIGRILCKISSIIFTIYRPENGRSAGDI